MHGRTLSRQTNVPLLADIEARFKTQWNYISDNEDEFLPWGIPGTPPGDGIVTFDYCILQLMATLTEASTGHYTLLHHQSRFTDRS